MDVCTRLIPLLLAIAPAAGFAQTTGSAQAGAMSLDDALKMAKQRNGTIRAGLWSEEAAAALVGQSLAQFYPSITPSYVYNSDRQQVLNTFGNQFIQTEGGSTQINSTWRLLDSGERGFNYRQFERSYQAQKNNTRQTVRTTLFSVVQQYYNALRAQELQRVSDSEFANFTEILKATRSRIEAKESAQIEELQAIADMENARVNALSARNQTATTAATLKATVGIDSDAPLPKLITPAEDPKPATTDSIENLTKEGLKSRPDLIAIQRSIESLNYATRLAEREASVTFGLDLTFNQQITPESLENRALVLNVSLPIFDGGQRKETVRSARATEQSSRSTLLQSIRSARAEIESAYSTYTQNAERLIAARAARDAARRNYQAADESRKAGAYSLLQVMTAEVSQVTAESNYIQAVYDYLISEVQLNLVTGRPIPGE